MSNIANQIFNSPNVNLDIKSFNSMAFWKEAMDTYHLKTIWDLIEWIAPVELFNIHNYQLIEKRFVKQPDRKKIFEYLKESDLYITVKMDLHNPFKGYDLIIHESIDKALTYKHQQATSLRLVKGVYKYILQVFSDPLVVNTISLVNPFVFYDEFSNFVSLGNTNRSKRSFCVFDGTELVTSKEIIGRNKNIVWQGIAFEFANPVRYKGLSKYHVIPEKVKSIKQDAGFYDPLRDLHQLISNYVVSANNDQQRMSLAERYVPIVYSHSEALMKDQRSRRVKLNMMYTDFDQCFTPYLEIGENTDYFTYGVVSR